MATSIAISKIRCENPNKKRRTPALNRNYLQYVATREGVDLTPSEISDAGSADGNAIYIRYISERPRSHGLFGNLPEHEIDDLDAICSSMYQLSKTQPIFKGILSLKEEDALTLGYDKKEKWEATLRIALPSVAEQLRIHPTELKWVAAFHQEKGHPHVHYMLWSKSDRITSAYIHSTVQHKCREIFSKHIFEEERPLHVIDKTIARDDIIESGKALIREELAQLYIPGTTSPEVAGRMHYDSLSKLSKELLHFCGSLPASGRLAYKYLPPEQKEALDRIVDEFLSSPPLKDKYRSFQKSMQDILKSYSVVGEKEERKMDQAVTDLKRRLGNVVLKELKSFRLALDQDQQPPAMLEADVDIPVAEYPGPAAINENGETPDITSIPDVDSVLYSMDWSKSYKKARSLIYDHATEESTVEGIKLLEDEAASSNVLAIYELAHIYETGLAGDEYDEEYPQLYRKALEGFNQLYLSAEEKTQNYIAYRIGKQYMRGQGCDVDCSTAASWFEKSSNQYAEYSLAKIYLSEDPSAPKAPIEKIKALLEDSSNQGFGYASYQLGTMYEFGNLVEANEAKAFGYYKSALSYFLTNSESATDNSIFFRLGTMYYHGKGTEKNLQEAIKYFVKAADLGNVNALLKLSKIYSETKDYQNLNKVKDKIEQQLDKLAASEALSDDLKKTVNIIHYHLARVYGDEESPLFHLEHSLYYYQVEAENGNQFAQYQLGKIFSQDNLVPRDLSIATSYLMESAEQGNNDARYALGKLYSDPELEVYDIPTAVKFLEEAAAEGHSFAQYRLGKIYSNQESDHFDLKLALKFLHASADQGNEQAIYRLGTIYANKAYDVYDITTALKFYHLAIDEYNNSFAKYQLGRMYLFGDGVDKNVILGMEYLKDASQDGNEYATALINYYQRSQILYVSYTISRGMLNLLSDHTHQNKQYQQELAKASTSKKHRKELAKKNQIKSSAPE